MIAQDIMSTPVYVVGLQENIAHARRLMLSHKISRLPVLDGDRLVGMITKKDLAYRLRQSDPIWRRRPIDKIPVHVLMVPDPVSVTADARVADIAALMMARDFSGLPVIDGKKLVGMVTKTDLLRSASVKNLGLPVSALMTEAVTVDRYHSLDHLINLMSERNEPLVVVNNDGTLAGIITESNLAFYRYSTDSSKGLPEKDVTMLRKGESGGRKRYRYVMEVHAVAEDIMSRPVITIGNFDGVHRGHQALFERLKEWAWKLNGESVVMTFYPQPLQVLAPETGPPVITLHERKIELIASCGIDVTIVIPFDHKFSRISAPSFVKDLLVDRIGVKAIVVGYDYRFGYGREGDIDFLRQMGDEYGFIVDIVAGVHLEETVVSSTLIRQLIRDGDMKEAGRLLGRLLEQTWLRPS